MRKLLISVVGLLLLVLASAAAPPPLASTARADSQTVLQFETMAGVSGPFVGAANPIRGVNGGGLPWVISSGQGQLAADGQLEIQVTGLVLANDPSVPDSLRGTNPVPFFRGLVSCLSIDSSGAPVTVNVNTGNFPASSDGNADIKATVELPHPCFAPIIFVTAPSGQWFSVTGN